MLAAYQRRRAACAQGKIKKLEDIFLFSMPVKEYQIVEFFLGAALKDEVMKIMPVQKQTRAGQRTRFKVGFCFKLLVQHLAQIPCGWTAAHFVTTCLLLSSTSGQSPVCLDVCTDILWALVQAFVVVGDSNGHVGLGVKCAKEVATAIR